MKKILSLALAAVLLMLTFVSCQNVSDNKTSSDTSGEANLQTISEPSEFVPEEVDYNGYEFRIFGFGPEKGSGWMGMYFNEIYSDEETGEVVNDAIYRRTCEIEDLYDIIIKPVMLDADSQRNNGAKIANTYIQAGDDAFDFALINGNNLPTIMAALDGYIELTTITNLDLSKSWWDQDSIKDLSIGGRLYTALGTTSTYALPGVVVLFANKKLINDYNIDNPYDLVRNNKWTWDVLGQMCRTVSKDLNGDGIFGVEDQMGLVFEDKALRYGLASAGIRCISKDSDDLPIITIVSDRSAYAFEKLTSVYYDTGVNFKWDANLKGLEDAGKVLVKYRMDEVLFFYNQMYVGLQLRDMESDFAILPAPLLDETQAKYFGTVNDSFATYTCIPVTNPDAERTANILQAFGYLSQQYVRPAFYDIAMTNKGARDTDSMEMLDIIISNVVYEMGYIYNVGGYTNMTDNMLRNRDLKFVSNCESIYSKMEADLNKMIETFEIN